MEKFCQSCGMPMDGHKFGTEKDGKESADYCTYCYRDGEFTADIEMDAMIEFCAQPMADNIPDMTKEQAIEQMEGYFPKLKRWAK